jgi:hypothetical protein
VNPFVVNSWFGVSLSSTQVIKKKCKFAERFSRLIFALVFVWTFPACAALLPARVAAQDAALTKLSTDQAPIKFWNRTIAVLRGNAAGAGPEDRAERASERLAEVPLNASPLDIAAVPITLENQEGIGFAFKGRLLFFLGSNDLDKESGETLQQASAAALGNIREALEARSAERTWPVIRTGLLYTVIGFVALVALCIAIWKIEAYATKFLRAREKLFSLKILRIDLLPSVATAVYGVLRVLAWVITFSLIYLWVTLSLRRFPYTEPWGRQAGSYVLNSISGLGNAVLRELPHLFIAILILLVTRWLSHMASGLFNQVATGRITIYWMDSDVA